MRSLKTILTQPGQLAREFESNRRASYISPVRALIFTSFLWFIFFTFQVENTTRPNENRSDTGQTPSERVAVNLEFEGVDRNLGIQVIRESLRGPKLRQFELVMQQSEQAPKRWFLLVAGMFQSVPRLPEWLRIGISNAAYDLTFSPSTLRNTLIDKFPMMMFVLLPWFTALLMLFYMRRGKRLFHHLVFAFHVHTFAFLVFTIILITPIPPEPFLDIEWSWYHYAAETIDGILITIFYVHTYMAFKRYYEDGYGKTLVKYLTLSLCYAIAVLPAFMVVLTLTLLDYV